MKKTKKKIIIISTSILLVIIIFFFSPYNYQKKIISLLPDFVEKKVKYVLNGIYNNLPEKLRYTLYLFEIEDKLWIFNNKKVSINSLKNDYNVKFLPESQFLNLRFIKKKLFNNNNEQILGTRHIDIFNDDTLLISNLDGTFSMVKVNIMKILEEEKLIAKKFDLDINSQIDLDINSKITDIFVDGDQLYFSFYKKKDKCNYFTISNLNLISFKSQIFFSSKECIEEDPAGGRIQKITHNGSEGLLVTTGGYVLNQPSMKPVKDESILGKTLFFNLETKEKVIFSKGHRNPQGLLFDKENQIILSTEHGPQGGDEINKIEYGKNYGWPISSYGKKYDDLFFYYKGMKYDPNLIDENLKYKKSHEKYGFEEPIFAFVPSIGISEIIKVPNNFSINWQDNYLVTSLMDKSLYRVRFSKNFDKVIFIEKIFVGHIIRDIKYSKKEKFFILSLQDKSELGFLFVE